METYPCFIDFEASGLGGDTYPIEVAWSLPDGAVKESLILPLGTWTYWDTNAEKVHGINRMDILRHGRPAAEICSNLIKDLAGQAVFCDGGLCDAGWLNQLLDAGTVEKCPFQLCYCIPDCFFPAPPPETVNILQKQAWKSVGKRHRAGTDVRWYLEYLREGRAAGYRDDVAGSLARGRFAL